MSRAVAFDKTTGACSACQEVRDSPVVSCVTCNAHCHVSCYQPRATTSREWMCDACNENLVEAFCHLCGHSNDQGIVRRMTSEEIQNLGVKVSKGMEGEPIFGHVFCLSFAHHPQSTPLDRVPKTRCDVCEKKYARLTCEKCTVAFHPFCALNGWGILQHDADGNIVVTCQAHRGQMSRPATTKQISPTPSASSSITPVLLPSNTQRDSTDLTAASPPPDPPAAPTTSKITSSSISPPPPPALNVTVSSSIPKKNPIPKVTPQPPLISAPPSSTASSTSNSATSAAKKTPLNPSAAASSSSSASSSTLARTSPAPIATKKPEAAKQIVPPKPASAKITAPSNSVATVSAKEAFQKRRESPPIASSSSSSAVAAAEKGSQSVVKKKPIIVNFDESSDDESSKSSTEMNRTLKTEASMERKQKEALESIQYQHDQSKEFGDDCCQVCGEEWTYPDEGDELVGCDGPCQSWYHQSCYGIPDLPPDDEKFFCWPCKAKLKRGSVKCVICQSTEGWGFVPVKYGNSAHLSVREAAKIKPPYAHVICVLWMRGTSFGNPVTRNPAIGIELIEKERFHLRCILCNNKKGAKIQCQEGECARAFHPLCMYRNKNTMYFDDHAVDDDILDNGKLVRPEKEYYCNHHSQVKLLKRERQTKIDAGESTEDVDKALRRLEMLPVKPTTSIAPASKMVAVPGLTSGKRKKVVVEVDPADVEARAKKYQERVEETKMELAELEKEEEAIHANKKQKLDLSYVTVDGNDSDNDMASKSTIDSDIIMSDSEESTASNEARKRLKKARLVKQTMPKLAMSSTASSKVAAASNNYSNEQRDKVRNMFLEFQPRKVATSIEEALFARHGHDSSNKAYVQQARDILSNLQNNEELSQQVFMGKVKAPELVSMSNEEMASESLKAKRAEQHEEAIRESTAKQSQIIINRKDGELLTVDQTN